ncbi:ComEC family competence protein [Fulvimarina endophytica]|uniref:ComEC family competence protein n=1 Tax=Fulvimarina endophytica TaxID=2293836 RepID=A0A371X4Y4_9HYPH|nr:ComEC/Rec2 family competence protein [Fulvimarina endophytica]RFC64269.1 ComEC family competence protein [Fulvimarina endophytica]
MRQRADEESFGAAAGAIPSGRANPFALRLPRLSRNAARDWFSAEWERERAHRTPFHLLPVTMAAGIVCIYGLHASLLLPAATLAVLLAHAVFGAGAGRPGLRAILLLTVSGFLAGQAAALIERERTTTTIFSGEASVQVSGRVLSHERDAKGRSRYVVEIEGTERPVLSRPPERARILVSSRHEVLKPGERYEGLVRLRPPSGPAYPGGYDFAFAPYFDGLGAYGFSMGAPAPPGAEKRAPSFGEWLRSRISAMRGAVTERIRAVIPGQPGAVAAALVTGQREGIDETVTEALRATGLAHILAISGLHVALVAGFAMVCVRRGLALSGRLALDRPIKKIAAVAAIAVASFYLVLSGSSVATDRAFLMLCVMLVAVLADRPAITMRNVSIAAILILALDPHAVMTASFQMSFAATIGLVGVYGAWSRHRGAAGTRRQTPSLAGRLLRVLLVGSAATALVAGLSTAPYAVYHFQRLAPFGIVANVLVMPLFSFLVMPAALVAMVLMPFGLDAPAFKLMGIGLQGVIGMAEALQARLADPVLGLVSPLALVLMTAALLIFTIPAGRLRWFAVPVLALALLAAAIRPPAPELLIFEDGKTFALLSDGALAFSRERPNGFVAEQWERAYGSAGADGSTGSAQAVIAGLEGCEAAICRFTTSSGLRIAYTTDYRLTGEACDSGDLAFVARAIRRSTCRSGTPLVTLRTLRRTGSLAVSRDVSTGRIVVERSIPEDPPAWNRHRLAPWPEYWRKPETEPVPDPGAAAGGLAGGADAMEGADVTGPPPP